MRDLLLGLFFLAFGILAVTWMIPVSIVAPSHLPLAALSPTLWPKIVAAMIAITGAVLAVQGGLGIRRIREKNSSDAATDGPPVTLGRHTLRVVVAMLLLIPYYIACQRFGLLLPSIPALAAFALLAGERSYLPLAVTALALPIALAWFFLNVANVIIPLGPLTGML